MPVSPKRLTNVYVVAGHVRLHVAAGDFGGLDAVRVPTWIRDVAIADLQRQDDRNLRAHVPL